MLEKLKSMIQYDLKNIEIEHNRVENDKLQKELTEKQKQAENEYNGRNKFKILMIDTFKHKDIASILAVLFSTFLLYVLFFSLSEMFKLVNMISTYSSIRDFCRDMLILTHLAFVSLMFIYFVVSKCDDKTKPHIVVENIKDRIESENYKNSHNLISIDLIFKDCYDECEKHVFKNTTVQIIEEAFKVLSEENINEVLRLSGNNNITYGYLIRVIREQEGRNR